MAKVFREGTHPVWAGFASVYLVGAVALTVYWLMTESGPIRWLADWQARTLFDGSWYPKITSLVVLVGVILPILPVRLVFDAIIRRRGARA